MSRKQTHLELITIVAKALKDLLERCVFVGGSISGFLITDPGAADVRATDDVDLIIEVSSYGAYAEIQDELRKLGFKHVIDGPNCRFSIADVIVDIMPTDESILGFHNEWHPDAIKFAELVILPSGIEIKIITAPLFLCTKFEAFGDRGGSDFYASSDMEDIVAVLDGRKELFYELCQSKVEVKNYLNRKFNEILATEDFLAALPGLVPPGSLGRDAVVLRRLKMLVDIATRQSFSGFIMANYSNTPPNAFIVENKRESLFREKIFENVEQLIECLQALRIKDIPQGDFKTRPGRLHELNEVLISDLSKYQLINPLLY